jgi:hypothetical protein
VPRAITTTSSRLVSGDDTDAAGGSPTHLGNPDLRAAASGYLGLFLAGVALLAIGTLISSLTRNQIVAAILVIAIGMGCGW